MEIEIFVVEGLVEIIIDELWVINEGVFLEMGVLWDGNEGNVKLVFGGEYEVDIFI